MASIETKLSELTKCSICLKTFTDPRILPCVHTFCLHCLKQFVNSAEKKVGEKMPCPLCRTEFIIPEDGVFGLKKNFFIDQLTDIKNPTNRQTSINSILCDICAAKMKDEGRYVSTATMMCLECQENLCDDCTSTHRVQKLSRYHHIANIGNHHREESTKFFHAKFCPKHAEKKLDYYCFQCKQIVCFSCSVETHSTHACMDVNAMGKDYLSKIQENVAKLANDSKKFLTKKVSAEKNRNEFLKRMEEKEKWILERSLVLKDAIDHHAKFLLEELLSLKETNLKQMDMDIEEIETGEAILENFKEYCNVLTSEGSPGHIIDCFDDIMNRIDELKKRDEALLGRPGKKVEISLRANDLTESAVLSHDNCIGDITVRSPGFEQFAIVVGIDDGPSITGEVLKINLNFPGDVQPLPNIPTLMKMGASADIYNNAMYVTGIGQNFNEIWKYDTDSGWKQCANLIHRRHWHSVAFVDGVMYICGGYGIQEKTSIDSIESYCAITNECRKIGKLIHAYRDSGNCVSYKKSLYIFGGMDKHDKNMPHVQVYNTENRTCSLLKHPMPSASRLKRAVVWQDSVILLGRYTCDIYNFKAESWNERTQFRTGVAHFGMCLVNDRVYVIGGVVDEKDSNGEIKWKCRDDVKYVWVIDIVENKPVKWKEHAKLPKPCKVHAWGMLSLTPQSTE